MTHTAADCLVVVIDASGLMEFFNEVTSWAYPITSWIEKNPETVGLIKWVLGGFFTVLALWVTGIFRWFFGLFKSKPKAASDSTEQLKVFIDRLTAQIDKRTAELSDANLDRGKLQQQIDELKRQLAEPETSLQQALERNEELESKLSQVSAQFDEMRIIAARDAIARFDYKFAEKLFFELANDEDKPNQLRAAAFYGLGEIAEARVDWLAALDFYENSSDLEATIETLFKSGEFNWRLGRYEIAETYYADLLTKIDASYGKRHEKYAEALNDLATVYVAQQRFSLAEQTCQRAINIDDLADNKNNPAFAAHLNNLGIIYKAQGMYDEAERAYKKALRIDQLTIGENNQSYAIHLNNLAAVYLAQEKYIQAEELFLKVVGIDQITLPKDHPDAASGLNNLARVYIEQGKYSAAWPLLEQSLNIFTDRLPTGHPNIKIVQDKLDICRAALVGVE